MAVVGRCMVATGLQLLEGERGGWSNSRHDVLTCTTVDSDNSMRCCHLDDVANPDGTVDMPRCLVVTWHWHIVAVVVAVCRSGCGQLTMVVGGGGCRRCGETAVGRGEGCGRCGALWPCWCCY